MAAPNPLFLRDEELTRGLELLDLAHQAALAQIDRRFAGTGFTRTHQRVLHFIGREPGITMVRLLGLVRVTKQTLSRLLQELETQELIVRSQDRRDRRRRLIELTPRGREIEEQVTGAVRRRLRLAYRAAGADAVAGHHRVLVGLIDERTRRALRLKE